MAKKKYWACLGSYVELYLYEDDARACHHQGRCDEDVATARTVPYIAKQLAALDPETVRKELRGYGAWDETQLADHNENLDRVLWLAAGNITEELN